MNQKLSGKPGAVHALVAMLEKLIATPALVERMQAENISRRESLAWSTRWPIWQELIEAARRSVAQKEESRDIDRQLYERFRKRRPSGLARARRIIVRNRMLFRGYDLVRSYCPGAIRLAKRAMDRRPL
ncbi:hypothetical protein [Salinihabitans flavidus]|uniref:hypothetical protein n=1 Tax=Salinihabitans flavidus TaxID=569882 RepID=UPI001113AFFB|nr:hypothetical protein [Salinihabitans flavidus]